MSAHLLAEVPILQNLPIEKLEYLVASLENCEVASGRIIFYEGEPGEHLYVVIYGKLDIIKSIGTLDERQVAICAEAAA